MSVALVIRSYLLDFPWLDWSVRSMRKFVTGLDERVLITPHGHLPREETLSYFDKHIQVLETYEGYMHQQTDKLQAWQHTDCDFLLFSDSDCIYNQPFDATSRISDSRAVLYRTLYEQLPPWCHHWRDVVERHLGIRPDHEYMRSQPLMHHRDALQLFCEEHPELLQFCRTCRDRKQFSEFNILGAFAASKCPHLYCFLDEQPHACKQYWSHAGLSPAIEQEIRLILA